MKVAVCLTGHMRTWEACFPSFKRYIIDIYNPDIFIHTWDKLNTKTNNNNYINDDSVNINSIIEQYNPKDIIIENWADVKNSIENRSKYFINKGIYDDPVNTISQHRKWFLCNELKNNYEKSHQISYEIVLKTRPDVVFTDNFIFNVDNLIYTPTLYSYETISDILAYGSSHLINIYCDIYNNLESIYDISQLRRYSLFNPHNVLMNYLLINNIQYKKINMPINLLR
jgi:hypothetical protein